jgi:environmental stress-induced protein Ves
MNKMQDWHLVSLDAAAPQPWRNGGGVTRELLTWPGGNAWAVRVSVADIAADGPFSRFERIERWFAVLEGAGVELRIGGGAQRLDPGTEALQFDGSAPVHCALVDGPTRDFNLMAAPGRAKLRRVVGSWDFRIDGAALLAVYAHEQPATLSILEETIEVPPRHLLWRHRTWRAHGTLSGDGALWLEAKTP